MIIEKKRKEKKGKEDASSNNKYIYSSIYII
jgi:hypothetical protein